MTTLWMALTGETVAAVLAAAGAAFWARRAFRTPVPATADDNA
jgi:hypothetical protein